jgi:hypothetical protein
MDGQNISNERSQGMNASQPMVCQIKIKGHLGHQWKEWFGGLTILLDEDGNTLLTGPVVDQAELHGILKKVRDLGMPLLALDTVGTSPQETSKDEYTGDS